MTNIPHPQGSLAERVLNTKNPDDIYDSISRAHHTLTGERIDGAELIKEQEELQRHLDERGDRQLYELDVGIVERCIEIGAIINNFRERDTGYVNLLNRWPIYEELHMQHGKPDHTPTRKRRALLIGSFSALTSAAFVAFSQDVLGASEAVIVDPRSSAAKRRHGTFVQANGLALPDNWSDSMDTVTTSHLVHMLLNTEGRLFTVKTERFALRALLRQARRVLRPGGSLLMNEIPIAWDLRDPNCETEYNQARIASLTEMLHQELTELEFTDIAIGKGWAMRGAEFLFDSTRQFNTHQRRPLHKMRTVYARKA